MPLKIPKWRLVEWNRGTTWSMHDDVKPCPVWNSSALPSTCSAIAPGSMKLQSIVIVHVRSSNHENQRPAISHQGHSRHTILPWLIIQMAQGLKSRAVVIDRDLGRDPLSLKCHFDRTTISINCPSTSSHSSQVFLQRWSTCHHWLHGGLLICVSQWQWKFVAKGKLANKLKV